MFFPEATGIPAIIVESFFVVVVPTPARLMPEDIQDMAYDSLRRNHPSNAHKRYLAILHLAAHESESGVGQILRIFMEKGKELSVENIRQALAEKQVQAPVPDIGPISINLAEYDEILQKQEVLI